MDEWPPDGAIYPADPLECTHPHADTTLDEWDCPDCGIRRVANDDPDDAYPWDNLR